VDESAHLLVISLLAAVRQWSALNSRYLKPPPLDDEARPNLRHHSLHRCTTMRLFSTLANSGPADAQLYDGAEPSSSPALLSPVPGSSRPPSGRLLRPSSLCGWRAYFI